MRVDFAITAALFVGLAAIAAVPHSEGFEVYHYKSDVEGTQFREYFVVTSVSLNGPVSPGEIAVYQNGQPLAVAWIDPDGKLGVGDQFHFVQEAFDQKTELTAQLAGKQVMACLFGGGAGVGIHPDEWREMGHPEEIRCLRDAGD